MIRIPALRSGLRRTTISPSTSYPQIGTNLHRLTGRTIRNVSNTASTSESGRRQNNDQKNKQEENHQESESHVRSFFNSTGWETAMGASAGVLLLGGAAMLYQTYYKAHVVSKMEAAFAPGYDPVLALVENSTEMAYVDITPPRPEQDLIDRIIQGKEAGRYFLILGSKGAGKQTMLIQAISRAKAEGVAFFEAHSDCEVVVDKFSESINYNMNRDYLGNLLDLSDLSGMSVFQSLERAMHKLEKALIRYSQHKGRPAIIIMNAAHLLPQDDDGKKILQLFQQRAEKWASSGVCTFVFTSNDYWIYDVLRKNSNRMDTLSVKDLSRAQSIDVLRKCRAHYFGVERAKEEDARGIFAKAYETLGGRVALLNTMARRSNLLKATEQLVEDDLQWLLSKTGIIEDHDDDVMDEQKWSTCSWLLFVELAKKHAALEGGEDSHDDSDSLAEQEGIDLDNDNGNVVSTAASSSSAHHLVDPSMDQEKDVRGEDVPNPHLTWGEARQVMTRPDFLTQLDQMNIIQVNRHHEIRADSMPLLRAFRRIAQEPGYEDKLERVMDRVSAIESLGRTRELVWKEQGEKGKFLIKHDHKGRELESWVLLGGDERLGREEEEDEK